MFKLFEESGFIKVKSAVVSGFQFKKDGTRNGAEEFGVKAVMMTAIKPDK